MATINLPPALPFLRRVSFNNLDPQAYEGPPQLLVPSENITFKNPSYGYGSLVVNDIAKAYSQASLYVPVRRRLKLPDAPARSILKNKLSQQQLQYNINNADSLGISYHGDLNDLVDHPPDHVPKLELAYVEGSAIEDDDDDDDESQPPPARRKLYSGMTDEELMALDPQFATTRPRTSVVDQFKFDSQTTYYLPAKRASVLGPAAGGPRLVYPSSNENNYKSILLTLKHRDYEQCDARRTILTVISGRHHSWNSLDWLVRARPGTQAPYFLTSGDYLVVTALLPTKAADRRRGSSSEKRRGSVSDDMTHYKKCENILNYLINRLPSQDLRLKITVELVLEPPAPSAVSAKPPPRGMKMLLAKVYNQYHPTLVVVGNRSTNLNFKYPLRVRKPSAVVPTSPPPSRPFGTPRVNDRYLIKLSSYLVKYSTVPVILVGNRCQVVATPRSVARKSSAVLAVLAVSQNSSEELVELEVKSFGGGRTDLDASLANEVSALADSENPARFADMVALVSDRSLGDSRTYLEALKTRDLEGNSIKFDDSVEFNSKVHSIYKSQSNGLMARSGEGAYKVKLMLDDPVDDKKEDKKDLLNSRKLEKIKSSTSSRASARSSHELAVPGEKLKPKKSFWKKIGIKK